MSRLENALPVAPSGRQLELRHGNQRAVVVEVGAGLREYSVGGWQVLDGYGAGEMCSAGRGQSLIPWPNRIADGRYDFGGRTHQLALTEPDRRTAIHGLVRWANWRVGEHSGHRLVMEHRLHAQVGYPFLLDLALEYELSAGGLRVTTTARNIGAERCPLGSGAHPYLTTGTPRVDGSVLHLPARRHLPADDRGMPVGSAPVDGTGYDFRTPRPVGGMVLDTAFTDLIRDADGMATVVLASPDGRRSAAVWMDASHTHVMAFTGDTLGDRARRSLGVEPMTCAPNAFRSGDGLHILEPGESRSVTWGITASAAAHPPDTAA